MEDWEIETETYVEPEEHGPIHTGIVSRDTVLVCNRCGIHNHLVDGTCIKCDRNLV